MKLRLITTLLILCSALMGCEKELPVYDGEVLYRDGMFYKPNSNVPLTAKVETYHENGQLKTQYTLIKGKKEGVLTVFYEDGQLNNKYALVNGKAEGVSKGWHQNGRLSFEATFVNGKEEGLEKHWYENGQLRYEYAYVNGELEGLWNSWSENGQELDPICYRADFKRNMSYCEAKE